jgi:ABC-2 type transport system ATP-binding protein
VPTSLLVVLGLVVLGALALAGVARWRHRPHAPEPDLVDVPLAVDGLVKQYANGFRAVDGVSWRAERGQVVGLLGPNGAGKTTTMRMLVGLIRADDGAVHVLGERVTLGAPVLGRVGALIEGPGFLPHLTGRENLRAYWAATGRPDDEAGYDDALAVADLGVAADKPVRSYSHGMKQRLGIAQAMLGQPDLLLLDEPTNGLDPPQIRAMRGVLSRYAEGGRTVVISSHLLAEVEQTCSHVVVMHRGRVVLEGAVAELVDGRRHLEEVFMGSVGQVGPAQVGGGS